MTTVRELLTGSLRLIGVASEGNTPTAQQLNDALFTLNENMDSWNANGRMIFTQHTLELIVGSSQQVYTIGPDGDLDTPVRPSKLDFASFKITSSSPNVEVPMWILSGDEWAAIQLKNIDSQVPMWCYLEPTFPLARLHLWPKPNTNGVVVLTMWQYLNSTLTLNTQVAFPPGYARLMRYNVAITIAPEYGIEVSDTIKSAYNNLKLEVQANNTRSNRLVLDIDLTPGVYNVMTDGYTTPQS